MGKQLQNYWCRYSINPNELTCIYVKTTYYIHVQQYYTVYYIYILYTKKLNAKQ